MITVPTDTIITKKLLGDLIEKHKNIKTSLTRRENYYEGKHDILERKLEASEFRKNRKVVVNHAKYITHINVGYFLGSPVEYQADAGVRGVDEVKEQYKKQTMPNHDHDLAEDMSIFGYSFDYTYYNENNELKSVKIDPRNCILVHDDTFDHNKLFAILYEVGEHDKLTRLTVIDQDYIYDWLSSDGTIAEDAIDETLHFFDSVPVVKYSNNSRDKSDYEDVETLIDAYNLLQSDRVNDKEQAVDAILLLYGFGLEDDQLEALKQKRTIKDIPEGAKAEYLKKELTESEVEVLKKALKQDIHEMSFTPDMTDENFVGNASGVAIDYKLLPFEWNTGNKERGFEKGLKERFALYNSYLNYLKSTPRIEMYKIDVVFKRSLPRNDFEISQMIANLLGTVDKETLVSQLSFITDAKKAVADARAEKLKELSQLSEQFGTGEPNKEEDPNKDDNQDPTKKEKPKGDAENQY